MLLAGLTITATKSKKTARTLEDTKLEMEIISQCGSGEIDDYRPSRTNMARMKLEGQLDVFEHSRITVPELVHMGDPAGGYVEMLNARNSARGHLMAWSEKRAMQEYLKGLTENSNLNRKEYGTNVPSRESNDMESYRKLEEVRRYSNKGLKVSRELIETVRGQKDFATLWKLKSFQYVSGIPGMAYNPFVNEEAGEAYFDYEQVIALNFWVERIKETGMLMVEQPKLGIILEERVVEPSVPELKEQVSFDCGSWDGPLKTSLVAMWELMKPSWCPHPIAGLIWDMTADVTLDLDDDASLHDLAMIHHRLAMRVTKWKNNPSTEPSEGSPSGNWLRQAHLFSSI